VTGFLGPLRKVKPGHENDVVMDGFECERQMYGTSISEIAKETE
jgi:hypothetical protein